MSGPSLKRTKKDMVFVRNRLEVFDKMEQFAVLATQGIDVPYTSLVAFAITTDRKKLLFSTTKGTRKYKNILNSEHVAVLVDNRSSGNKALLETEAITVLGLARPVRRGRVWNEYAKVFLAKHPDFDSFLKTRTTALIAVDIIQCIHVGNFQVVTLWEPEPSPVSES